MSGMFGLSICIEKLINVCRDWLVKRAVGRLLGVEYLQLMHLRPAVAFVWKVSCDSGGEIVHDCYDPELSRGVRASRLKAFPLDESRAEAQCRFGKTAMTLRSLGLADARRIQSESSFQVY
ncbi:hypothetical protein Ancab_025481 [Ancistrocladus abbreviatus]